ncbi:MAG TPA: hypothetical protein VM030_10625 [Acidimicrobiales bacterium]|nr:hypothetical protein [Acidimicrobiales bacterium]
MTRRLVAGVMLAALAAAVVMPAPAPRRAPAVATAPTSHGWWSRAQAAPAPAPLLPAPPGPIAPADGLFVQQAPRTTPPDPLDPKAFEPAAVAALRFGGVPADTEATLTLKIASGSPDGPVTACVPARGTPPWQPAQFGRWEDRPEPDCQIAAAAPSVSADGTTLTWTLNPNFVLTPGVIDIVLVPEGQAPFQVGFAKPGVEALVTRPARPADLPPGAGGEVASEPPPDEPTSYQEQALGSAASDYGLPPPPPEAPAAPAAGAVEPRRSPVALAAAVPAAFRDTTRGQRILAVLLLFGLVGGLWWLGGYQVRAPRSLVPMGSAPAVAPVPVRRGVRRS